MTEEGKPDQPTVYEILASIRRITAENSASGVAQLRFEQATIPPPQPPDSDDFELPAMFRQGRAPHMAPSPSLIARLSGAMNPAPEAVELRPREPPSLAEAKPVGRASAEREEQGLSRPPWDDVPRDMPSCMDRVLMRMGQPESIERPGSVALPRTYKPPKGSLRVNYLLGSGSLVVADAEEVAGIATMEPIDRAQREPLKHGAPSAGEPRREEADLLRPLVRQWLDENISRILAQTLANTLRGDGDR